MFFSKNFDFSKIPDLTGKIAIITGSNTGIGKVCALEMARQNCQIIVASRSEEKGQAAVTEIKSATGNDKVEFMKLDLLSLEAVKAFAEEFTAKFDKLHILLNNAGVMMCPYGLSKDGIEIQFATNHVAHYYLTMQLLPLLIKSGPSRIVNVSSMGHHSTSVYAPNFTDKISEKKGYNATLQYGFTKACNIMFTRELAKRLEAQGIDNVYVNCNHPGVVSSELSRHIASPKSFLDSVYNNYLAITTENGSLTQLYLATSPEVESKQIKGQYYVPYAASGWANPYSRSEKNAADLWEYTEKLLKEKVPDYQGAAI
ncbi:hypothetical protein BDB00DRAFT_818425 [Zychaea mexicana]|uniref:uncharacterized protein n=1 Tax=Zychaea mexicana TaxID=64656 RepID=UPI0022FE6F41|nr:uncharacterized protein BDB00DRAFT_818425 [Zychaea mexicana]KAI9494536.1 hypothetical protein BDB00DRAFT_818425 [Zychaea mexicana]